MSRATRTSAGLAAGAALLAGGCGQTARGLLETASIAVSPAASVHAESPVEIYTRVARGALACWFGANGSLKRTHVFHADVAPESKGGEAEIVLHERDSAAPSPRALRAFRVVIVKDASGSRLASENLRLPDAVATDMQADVRRWAGGATGCSVVGTGGWAAGQQREPEPAKAVPVKRKAPKQKPRRE